MKKILTILIIFFTYFNLHSQHYLGVNGGMHIGSNIYSSELRNTESRKGVEFGLFYKYKFASYFFVQPEINFIQKGGKGQFPADYFNIHSNYLKIGFLGGFQMDFKNFFYSLYSGIYYADLISENTSGKLFNSETTIFIENNESILGWDYGFGFGYQKDKYSFGLNFRYRRDIKDFKIVNVQFDSVGIKTSNRIRNKGLTIGITILREIGK